MFLTSVDELIQQDFRLSRTLHDELSSIRLIRTYFSNTFLSWVLYFWQGNSQEQFRNVLYSVYMLNAQSHMQSQIVLTVAVLRVVDIVPILLKQKKIWKSMVTDTNVLTYTDNCGRKCKANSDALMFVFSCINHFRYRC